MSSSQPASVSILIGLAVMATIGTIVLLFKDDKATTIQPPAPLDHSVCVAYTDSIMMQFERLERVIEDYQGIVNDYHTMLIECRAQKHSHE